MREKPLSAVLLDWYDVHARVMPWRVSPQDRMAGVRPDPYRIWLSEIMLQQTTVAAVGAYFETFTRLWPTVTALAEAEDADVMAAWAGLGYYARARNLLKCARTVVADHGGTFPETHAALLKLPGIGPYTAGAMSAIAFDLPEVVVDGNVERVMARMFAEETPLPAAKPILTDHAQRLTPDARPGDYAQAVMDLGATICTPRRPACGICPWMERCDGRATGVAAALPHKIRKAPKPIRQGYVYVARRRDGAFLMERRPDKGLLGGMLGWPGSEWAERVEPRPPCDADWAEAGVEVRHTFTHFHLRLQVLTATLAKWPDLAEGQIWVAAETFDPRSLPTVMRKAYDVTPFRSDGV